MSSLLRFEFRSDVMNERWGYGKSSIIVFAVEILKFNLSKFKCCFEEKNTSYRFVLHLKRSAPRLTIVERAQWTIRRFFLLLLLFFYSFFFCSLSTDTTGRLEMSCMFCSSHGRIATHNIDLCDDIWFARFYGVYNCHFSALCKQLD